jgi:Domain of unknown function DUF29
MGDAKRARRLLGRIFDVMHAAEVFARVHADGREQASAETGLPLRIYPRSSPCTLERTLDPEFLPD